VTRENKDLLPTNPARWTSVWSSRMGRRCEAAWGMAWEFMWVPCGWRLTSGSSSSSLETYSMRSWCKSWRNVYSSMAAKLEQEYTRIYRKSCWRMYRKLLFSTPLKRPIYSYYRSPQFHLEIKSQRSVWVAEQEGSVIRQRESSHPDPTPTRPLSPHQIEALSCNERNLGIIKWAPGTWLQRK